MFVVGIGGGVVVGIGGGLVVGIGGGVVVGIGGGLVVGIGGGLVVGTFMVIINKPVILAIFERVEIEPSNLKMKVSNQLYL